MSIVLRAEGGIFMLPLREVDWPPQADAGFSTEATIGLIFFIFLPPLHPYYGVS